MIKVRGKFNYDLEERLAIFVENIIELMEQLPNNYINNRMISQLVSSSGSSSANYLPR